MTDRTEDPAQDAPDAGDYQRLDREAVAALEQLLLARGPLGVEELTAALEAADADLAGRLRARRLGDDLAGGVLMLARQSDELWRLPDGRLAPVLHHLRRATFTHRVRADELERDALDLCPDLVALALPRSFDTVAGASLRTAGSADDPAAAEEGSIVGPAGWLASCGAVAGGLLAVRYDGTTAHIEPIADDSLDAADGTVTAALAAAFEAIHAERAPEVHRLVVDTIGTTPNAFAFAVAPLAELLPVAGLSVRQAWVGRAGERWPTPPEQARRRRLEELLRDLDRCCAGCAREALDEWHDWMREREPDPARSAGNADPARSAGNADPARSAGNIEHGPVAALLAEVATLGPPAVSLRRLGAWAAAVEAAAGTNLPGVAYLQALGADASGDVATAEALLRAALAAAPDHPACLGLLAEYTEDRGDAQEALTLLRRAGRPPGPEAMAELAPFLADRRVGRNDPCPCGSGRKYKACCSGRTLRLPLTSRCRWLLQRAARHAVRNNPTAVASLRQLFDSSVGGGETMALAGDMLLFSTGGLARYLDSRGLLLPADEAEAARGWLHQPMRVLEVGASTPGTGTDGGSIEMTDLAVGERLVVDDRSASTSLTPGEIVLTRALPAGEQWLLTSAVVRVPASSRERAVVLVAGEVRPFELLHFLVDLQVDAIRS